MKRFITSNWFVLSATWVTTVILLGLVARITWSLLAIGWGLLP